MRENWFRAKTIENNQWVEGYFVYIPCGRFLSEEWLIQTIKEDGRIGHLHTVYERTVEQFTGRFDKNGKRIFEGDIIKNEYEAGKIQYFQIVYNEDAMRWSVMNKYRMQGHLCHVFGSMEIIGNIHDNPELLEVDHGNQ